MMQSVFEMRIKLDYNFQQRKKASTLLSLAQGELASAQALFNEGFYRESVVHMYFTCFYLAQAFLAHKIQSKGRGMPNHKRIASAFNEAYGRRARFPRAYVQLHNELLGLRIDHHYRLLPPPVQSFLKQKIHTLWEYLEFAYKHIPKIGILDVLKDVHEDNDELVCDISYDIYCPKTYRHHTRLTFWQPPIYLGECLPEEICAKAKKMLASFSVPRTREYVIGINSRLDQYADVQLIMLDIDVRDLNNSVENALRKVGGVLFRSGRGFHFVGNTPIVGRSKWRKQMRSFLRDRDLKGYVDKKHVTISLERGYSTLRITSSPTKPLTPIFFKEIK